MDVNQLFPWFSTRSDREGSLIAEWRANNFERRRLFKIILLRWRITLLKQRGQRAEWNSRNILYSLRNGFQVVYLFDVWKHGSRGRLNCQEASINSKKQKISHRKGKKFSLNGGCFQELRRVSSDWESLCGCNLQCVNMSIIWVSSKKHSTNSFSS